MNFRALALGVTVGFLAAVVPSCGKGGPSSTGGGAGGSGGSNAGGGTGGNTGGGTGVGGGGSTGNCNATTCANGCCNSGICIPATATAQSATNCGTGGQTCMMCPSGNVCSQGMCRFMDAGQPTVTGEPCTMPGQCTALGAGSTCKTTTTIGGAAYPGGYCSLQPCTQTNRCGDDAVCTNVPLSFGENAPLCLKKCSVGAMNCRTGYQCYRLQTGSDNGVCYIAPTGLPMNVDAGPPSDKIGNACTMDSQCQNPPNPPFQNLGFCIPPTLTDGGPTGFTGGSCFAECQDFDLCGDAGVCLGVSQTEAWCFPKCTNPGGGQGNCRNGYVCQPSFFNDGGVAPDSYCDTSCLAPGNACNTAQGFFCDAGYCVR